MGSAPFFLASCLLFAFAPVALAKGPPPAAERFYDDEGRLLWEHGQQPGEDGIDFVRHYTYLASRDGAKPEGGGGRPGGVDPGTDCESDAYKRGGWRWTEPYAAFASAHADLFSASAERWDERTEADILGSISAGLAGIAGERDSVNQFDFVDLGASTTIAVTTTWYNTFTGVAVESDAQYNTHYAWATDGTATAMDVANIATHELGHTFGLVHPNTKPGNGCLTMYPYASEGELAKATLGDGDVLGVKAVYGD